ncbi:MAG: class I SAM-dependent methyltransferase [Steroidobacteraceae bacterium]
MKALIHHLGRAYQRRILRSEAESQKFTRYNERPAEFAFVLRCVGRCAPRTILDVGSGTTALPAILSDCGAVVTAIDNVRDYWSSGMINRHWHIEDQDIQRPQIPKRFDMVTCISVLEHIADHRAAVGNIMRLVKLGGHFVLAGPYTDREYVEDTYRVMGADAQSSAMPYICRSYSRAELEGWLKENGGELIEEEYWRTWTGRHWAQGERIAPPTPSTREGNHTHACFLIRRGS